MFIFQIYLVILVFLPTFSLESTVEKPGSIVLKYIFHDQENGTCRTSTLGSTSRFVALHERRKILLVNSTVQNMTLSISCTAAEPIRWVLHPRETLSYYSGQRESYFHLLPESESGGEYTICMSFKKSAVLSGTARCVSFLNESFAAEISVAQENGKPAPPHPNSLTNSTDTVHGLECRVRDEKCEVSRLELIQSTSLTDSGMEVTYSNQMGGPFVEILQKSNMSGAVNHDLTHGTVSCHASCGGRVYVSTDHLFTGIDLRQYFVSRGYPPTAIIQIHREKASSIGQSFTCLISTFMLFDTFIFHLRFTNGTLITVDTEKRQHHRLHLNGNYRLSEVKRRLRGAAVTIDVFIPNLVNITCRSPFRNSLEWASSTWNTSLEPAAESAALAEALREFPSPDGAGDSKVKNIIIISSIIGAVALVIAAICCGSRRSKKDENPIHTEFNIQDSYAFFNGTDASPEQPLSNIGGVQVDTLGFPGDFQLPLGLVKIHDGEVLHQAKYYRHVRGEFKGKPVVAKVMRPSKEAKHLKNFLRELKILAHLGNHVNIVRFYGAVVEDILNGFCTSLTELSPFGDLVIFLRQYSPEKYPTKHKKKVLNDFYLVSFCAQIAAGMEYVAEKNVVHGDLTSRNILVFNDYVVKISDFTLHSKLCESGNNSGGRGQKVNYSSWQWMAPESLRNSEFTSLSDVWSYGVVAWEIFSLGQIPFARTSWSSDFPDKLAQGLRLSKPQRTTEPIYQFLKSCWNQSPSDRPSFGTAKTFFRTFVYGAEDDEEDYDYV